MSDDHLHWCESGGELPVGSEVQFLQVYARSVADVAEVGVAAIDQLNFSHFFAFVEIFLFLVGGVVLFLRVLVF